MMSRPTKLGVGVGSIRVNGVLDGLVVGLDGNLALASTALVLVVLDLAGGDILGAHDCDVVAVCVGLVVLCGVVLEIVGMMRSFV